MLKSVAIIIALSLLFSFCILFSNNSAESLEAFNETTCLSTIKLPAKKEDNTYTALNYTTVKAMWISQFDMYEVYTKGGAQRPVEDYTEKVKRMISNISSLGINTVFFQLRPNGDSLYPSELFPASKYATGRYGRELDYDPFDIFSDIAHKANISVHAWINPMRCMTEEEISSISESYIIKKWYSDGSPFISKVNSVCYLNPAYNETRELICRGVLEIISNYEVDGVHIDDYFYPTTDESFDSAAYNEYAKAKETMSLSEFRREQIDTLVRGIYSTVKNYNHTILFGISPGGNNNRNYNELYANIYEWCANDGYIDYLCPQIYFGFEHQTHSFYKICDEFCNIIQKDDIKLIIGTTLGKAYDGYNGEGDKWAGVGKNEWIENRDILKRSLEYVSNKENCAGVAFFSYRYFFDPLTSVPIPETSEEIEAFLPILKKFRSV